MEPGRALQSRRSGSLAAWLHTIARNRTVDRLRAAGRRPNLVPFSASERRRTSRTRRRLDRVAASGTILGGAALGPGPEGELAATELRHDPRGARRAADDERTAIVLAYREELTQTEIAERLGWPLGTVKTRTRRALLRLREALPRSSARGGAGADPGADRRTNARTMMGAMDHDEVRELLEDAAVEPDGLERLMAGDTPTAALVAGHLAGCPDCTRRARPAPPIGRADPADASVPCRRPSSGTGRSRYVAAARPPAGPGQPRPPVDRSAAAAVAARIRADARVRGTARSRSSPVSPPPWSWRSRGTALIVNGNRDALGRARRREIEALGDVAPLDGSHRRPSRTSSASGSRARPAAATTGTLVFSPSIDRARRRRRRAGARRPPVTEYRCWVEVDGRRAGDRQDVLRRRSRLLGRRRAGGRRAGRRAPGSASRSSISPHRDQPAEPVLVSAG